MKYIKHFESNIGEEYGIPPPEIESVPGFEGGTIDPEDDDAYEDLDGVLKSDKERYQDFLKITKERNFKETEDELIINIYRLWHDFYMSIYENEKHYKSFLRKELIGKYISQGYFDILTGKVYTGIIDGVGFIFDDELCIVSFRLRNLPITNNGCCKKHITIDKLKSDANKYNL